MTRPRPAIPAHDVAVRLGDGDDPFGWSSVPVVAWSDEGDALILHADRLIRAQDHPAFQEVFFPVPSHADNYVPADPGWRAHVTPEDGHREGRLYPVVMWRVSQLGNFCHARPMVPEDSDDATDSQHVIDPMQHGYLVRIAQSPKPERAAAR